MEKKKNIPYGRSDFAEMSEFNTYYVDKTHYIPEIEKLSYVFMIRPRRFGKSLFSTMLQYYYDVTDVDKFETYFKNTWILNNPTEERGKYMILAFDFSRISKEEDSPQIAFNKYCMHCFEVFTVVYKDYFSEEIIKKLLNAKSAHDQFLILKIAMLENDYKLYIFIDEYDHFTNTLLVTHGKDAYHQITHTDGFFKQFFTNLKGMTSGKGSMLKRLYITGVSPVTMDDVTSGFNIGTNISLESAFNSVMGFTEKEIHEVFDYFTDDKGAKLQPNLLETMRKWYNNYLFSEKSKEPVFNTTGSWYFIRTVLSENEVPSYLIDENLRIDYTKLKDLVYHGTQLNGNINVLADIINNGGVANKVTPSFPYDLVKRESNYISLLYFFGFLTHSGEMVAQKPYLCIPNETIKRLVYDYFSTILEDAYGDVNWIYKLSNLISALANKGEYKPIIEFINELLNMQTKIRDFKEGEGIVKSHFNTFLGMNDLFETYTEHELNKGFADIVLFPFHQKYHGIKYAYLIEIKYISRKVKKDNIESEVEKKIYEAKEQLDQYSADQKSRKIYSIEPFGQVILKKIIIVYHGWDLMYYEEYHN